MRNQSTLQAAGLAMLLLVMACAQSTTPSPSPPPTSDAPSEIPTHTPPTQTLAPLPTATSTPSSPPYSASSDVCLLYRQEGALWLKQGDASPAQIAGSHYGASEAQCPPQSLLPQVEVSSSEPGTSEIEWRHLIPHLCLQHPSKEEVWFNTERPLGYGKLYSSDLWRYDGGQNTVEQILGEGQGGQFFYFSPDGQRLVLADNRRILVMQTDGGGLQTLFEFPDYAVCSEVNVWVTPMWLPDSSGALVYIPEGCLHSPDSWPFGLWWVSLQEPARSIETFSQDRLRSSGTFLDASPGPRRLDPQRTVTWENGTIVLHRENLPPLSLAPLNTLEDGYIAFLCP